MSLKGKTIAVCVTGGIAVYKACDIVSKLVKQGAQVHVVMTQNAKQFVSPLTFETLCGNKVISDMFDPNREWEVEHISLAKKSDLFLIAPCTANMAGKLAAGIADDFLSTTVMAARCPVVIAPAMNTGMLESAAYRSNEQTLKDRGFIFVESENGMLACGDTGKGRLASTDSILEKMIEILAPRQDLQGKKVLVTAGATREYIDPVRYITNRSSGRMGVEIARAAAERGAEVVLVAGFISVPLPSGCEVIKVQTTAEMYTAVTAEAEKECDYYIMAAAPADYKPKAEAKNKIKSQSLSLEFVKNPDIAAAAGGQKGKGKLVIFCAETENLIENARSKLKSKNADMVVANNVLEPGAGFDVDTNIATIITHLQEVSHGIMPKEHLAHIILDTVIQL